MKDLEKQLRLDIEKVRNEILLLTNQIGTIREESNEDDLSGIGRELQDRLELLNERLLYLQKNLVTYQNAVLTKFVCIGKTLDLDDEKSRKLKITVVLPENADSLNSYISSESPLGKALLNKSIGEVVEFPSPSGVRKMKITKIY